MRRHICIFRHPSGISASELLPQDVQALSGICHRLCILFILVLKQWREASALHIGRGVELFKCKLSAAITLVWVCVAFNAAAHACRCPHIAGRLQ